MTEPPLKRTPLYALHEELGAKFAPFAGYALPLQFEGILAEHRHTRAAASLFDVSHMGQASLDVDGRDHDQVATVFESLVPGDIRALKPGGLRYTLLLNDHGGILDDLMVGRAFDEDCQGTLFLVVNGATKDADFAHIAGRIAKRAHLHRLDERALIALQGPAAANVLAEHAPGAARLAFMEAAWMPLSGKRAWISRSGYTGEDGFEISIPAVDADDVARLLLSDPRVRPAGLGARDSLRLEAGLCLYGHDLNPDIDPVTANLSWTVAKRRRDEGGFPGAERILRILAEGAPRRRVGLRPEGRVVAREGTEILDSAGSVVGIVTSGTFGPTVGGPIAMGYVGRRFAEPGTKLALRVRDRLHPAEVARLPFVPHRYYRG